LGNDPSKLQNKDDKAPTGIPCSHSLQKKPAVAVRPTISGSSREQSDDEDEISITENMNPTDAKRVRR